MAKKSTKSAESAQLALSPIYPAPTQAQLDEAAKLDQLAQEEEQARQDSFERCDTDGFLSQHCHALKADEYRHAAQLLRQGGMEYLPRLVRIADGKVVRAKLITHKSPWGMKESWMLVDQNGKPTGTFFPNAPKSRKLGLAGVAIRNVLVPCKAKLKAYGTGMAGLASMSVISMPLEDFPQDAVDL